MGIVQCKNSEGGFSHGYEVLHMTYKWCKEYGPRTELQGALRALQKKCLGIRLHVVTNSELFIWD